MNYRARLLIVVAMIGCSEHPMLPTEPAQTRVNLTNDRNLARTRAARDVRMIEPSCPQPAPLHLSDCPGPGYIVLLKAGNDATSVALTLGARYGFSARSIWQQTLGVPAFYAVVSAQTVALLRCEALVSDIEENGIGSFPETPVCR